MKIVNQSAKINPCEAIVGNKKVVASYNENDLLTGIISLFGFVIFETVLVPEERDITANPREGLSPLGVQFKDVAAEE